MAADRKIDLHELYLSLDDGVLREAWDAAARRGDKDEAEFWCKTLDNWIQARHKKLVVAGASVEDEEDKIFLHGKDRNWTLREYLDLQRQWREAVERGDEDADEMLRVIPVDPDLAMSRKILRGKEAVLASGWDLTEANLKFGEGWLDR